MAATKTLSRRHLIAAMGALPIAALAVPALAQAPSIDTAEWDRLKRLYDAAQAEEDAYNRDVFDPAYAAWQTAIAAIPHVEVPVRYTRSGPATMTTASESDLSVARAALRDSLEGRNRAEVIDFTRSCRALIAGADAREAERARIDAAHDIDALTDRSEALGDRAYGLKWQLIEMPAPHREALHWKLERLITPDAVCWNEPIIDGLLSDAGRLLTGQA